MESFDYVAYLNLQELIDFNDFIRDLLLISNGEDFFKIFKDKEILKEVMDGIVVGKKEKEFFKKNGVDLDELSNKFKFKFSIREKED